MTHFKADLSTEFFRYLASEKGLAIKSLEAYRADLKKFFTYLRQIGIHSLEELETSDLVNYLNMLKLKSYAESTICRALISLKLFFRFAFSEGFLPRNITLSLESPRIWQLIPEVLTIEETESLLAQPDIQTAEGSRDRAILELLYATGVRVSECCSLGVYDVDDSYVRVIGKGNKERVIPIGQKAIHAIDHYIIHFRGIVESEKDPLFINERGRRIDRFLVFNLVKGYAETAQIKKNVSPHTLRHSFATHLLENGAELRVIQEMLGHANISSTDRYTQISQNHVQKAFHAFHPRS